VENSPKCGKLRLFTQKRKKKPPRIGRNTPFFNFPLKAIFLCNSKETPKKRGKAILKASISYYLIETQNFKKNP
jgi:hypothetical protein